MYSVADFDPQHWGPLDKYFSTRCPSLRTFTLVFAPYVKRSSRVRYDEHLIQDMEPAVRKAVELTVRAQMAGTFRKASFRLGLAR